MPTQRTRRAASGNSKPAVQRAKKRTDRKQQVTTHQATPVAKKKSKSKEKVRKQSAKAKAASASSDPRAQALHAMMVAFRSLAPSKGHTLH